MQQGTYTQAHIGRRIRIREGKSLSLLLLYQHRGINIELNQSLHVGSIIFVPRRRSRLSEKVSFPSVSTSAQSSADIEISSMQAQGYLPRS